MPSAFVCTECNGTGRILSGGNTPSPWDVTCDVCDGSGELNPQQAYDDAVGRMMGARNTAHLFRANRAVYFRYWEQAMHWLKVAKQARAALLEGEHAGANHLGRAA